jgi:hypothetical protein
MYEVYLDKILMPVAPEKITYKTESRNSTIELINMEEISLINSPGLTEYSFDVLLPGGKVPYANYLTTYKEPYVYIGEFEEILKNKKAVLFRFIRKDLPYNRPGFTIKKMVTLESFTVTESADDGFDVYVSLRLKEFKEASSTKYMTEESFSSLENSSRTEKEKASSYTVKDGDSLWKICRQELNDGNRCYEIASLNNISNPDLIYPGQVIRFE